MFIKGRNIFETKLSLLRLRCNLLFLSLLLAPLFLVILLVYLIYVQGEAAHLDVLRLDN